MSKQVPNSMWSLWNYERCGEWKHFRLEIIFALRLIWGPVVLQHVHRDSFNLLFCQYGEMQQRLCRVFPVWKWGRLSQNHIVYWFSGVRQNISALTGPSHCRVLTLYGQHSKFDKSSCAQLHVCQHACRGLWDGERQTEREREFMTRTFTLTANVLEKLPAASLWQQSDYREASLKTTTSVC